MHNTITAEPLVITATGGEKGGGSEISADAKQLIKYYLDLRAVLPGIHLSAVGPRNEAMVYVRGFDV